jgi:hypothetical protein
MLAKSSFDLRVRLGRGPSGGSLGGFSGGKMGTNSLIGKHSGGSGGRCVPRRPIPYARAHARVSARARVAFKYNDPPDPPILDIELKKTIKTKTLRSELPKVCPTRFQPISHPSIHPDTDRGFR